MSTLETRATTQTSPHTARLSIFTVGMSLGALLAISFVICVIFDLLFPAYAMNSAWAMFLPGFKWLSFSSFVIGFFETFLYGWYIAVVFVPIYNWFSR